MFALFRKYWKWWGGAFVLFFVVLTAIILYVLLPADRWKPVIKAQLEQMLLQPVEIRDLSISLTNGIQFQIRGLQVGGVKPSLEAETVTLSFSWLSLLWGGREPSAVWVHRPLLTLQERDGSWGLATEKIKTSASTLAGSPPSLIAKTQPAVILPHSLRIEQGSMRLWRSSSAEPLTVNSYSFSFERKKGSALGVTPFQADLHAENLQSKTSRVSSLQVTVEGTYREMPPSVQLQKAVIQVGQSILQLTGQVENIGAEASGKLHFQTTGAQPEDLLKLAALFRGGEVPVKTSGRIQADLTLEGPLANPRLAGRIQSDEMQFIYTDLPEPIRLSRISLDLSGDQIKSNTFQAGLGGKDSVALSLEVEQLGSDPTLRFHAETRQPVPLLELLRIASSLGFHLPSNFHIVSGNAAFQLNGRGIRLKSGRFDVDGNITLNALAVQPKQSKDILAFSPVKVTLNKDHLQANRFVVSLPDAGSMEILGLDLSNPGVGIAYQAKVRTVEPLNAGRWLSFARGMEMALPEAVQVEKGRVTLTADMKQAAGRALELSLDGRFQNGSLQLKSLREPMIIEDVFFNLQAGNFTVRNLKSRFLDSHVQGEIHGAVGESGLKPIRFQLQLDTLNLDRLQEISASQTAGKASSGRPTAGSVGLQIEAGSLQIQRAKIKNTELADARLILTLKDQVLDVSSMDFLLSEGRHQGSLRVDLHTSRFPFHYQGRVQDLDMLLYLKNSSRYRGALLGRLQTELTVDGEVQNSGILNPSTRGEGQYQVSDGLFTHVSLARQIQALTRLTGWDISSKGTEIQEAKGTFRLEGSNLLLKDSNVRTPEATLTVSGRINLENQSVNLTTIAELSSEWKPSGNSLGQLVGGAAEVFFRDEDGRMLVPLQVSGSLDHLAFSLDRETVRTGLHRALKPENIRSGVRALRNILQQVTGEPNPDPSPSTTVPPKPR